MPLKNRSNRRKIFATSLTALSLTSGCATLPGPSLEGELWEGDSVHGEMFRGQDKKAISCTDPAFDQFTCEKTTDFAALLKACKQWR